MDPPDPIRVFGATIYPSKMHPIISNDFFATPLIMQALGVIKHGKSAHDSADRGRVSAMNTRAPLRFEGLGISFLNTTAQ